MSADFIDSACARIRDAAERGQRLQIVGHNSKHRFSPHYTDAEPLDTREHQGILRYEPSELFVTVRAGTRLDGLIETLAEQRQILPFDPPQFEAQGSIGGAVASGLSGPARPWRGAARDLVLGVTLVNGRGEKLRFGGEVMKNVAGYDVSRLQCGAYGRLGLIADVSLKLLPAPEAEVTQVLSLSRSEALASFTRWAGQPWPITAMAHWQGKAYVRLSGAHAGVEHAAAQIGGEREDNCPLWAEWRDQRGAFFHPEAALWRLSLPFARECRLAGEQLIEWGGAQVWLQSDASEADVYAEAQRLGGHALRLNPRPQCATRPPLAPAVARVSARIEAAFDPQGVFAPQPEG